MFDIGIFKRQFWQFQIIARSPIKQLRKKRNQLIIVDGGDVKP